MTRTYKKRNRRYWKEEIKINAIEREEKKKQVCECIHSKTCKYFARS
jgi:hypothetical protein